MEASISQKRDAMQLCQKIIPMMEQEEIAVIAYVLEQTLDRLIKEGHKIED